MKKHFKTLISWILSGYNDHEAWEEWMTSQKEIPQSCENCRFKNHYWDRCWVGTYWAGKGSSVICYEGELWEARVSDKTKNLLK